MFYIIFLFLLLSATTVGYSFLILQKNTYSVQNMILINIFLGLFSNSIALLSMRQFFNQSPFILRTPQQYIAYTCLFIAFSIIVSSFSLFIIRTFWPKKKNVHIKITMKLALITLVKTLLIPLFILGVFLWAGASWFIHYFGELTPEQFLFNLNSPIKGTSTDVYTNMSHTPVLILISTTLIFIALLFLKLPSNRTHRVHQKMNWNALKTLTLSVVAISTALFGITYSIQTLHLMEVYSAYNDVSTYIQDNYVDPKIIPLEFPSQKQNLIHIYVESIESSYFSKELGGYMDENLMPEMYELSQTGTHFSHNDQMGGSHQTYGSSWSVAGMVNMEAGIPLKIPMDGNSYGKSGEFLPGIKNLGDILHEQGYNQTIMFGADAEFGGLDVYFKKHGDFHIFDVKEAKHQKLIPQDYNVWWGFEDDKLYEYAKMEISRLDSLNQPFHFNMETADTHFPDGYPSKNLKRSRESQYADVIAFSTQQTVDFVKWIQAQPFYEHTTIVITGDHLSMDKKFFETFDNDYLRTPFNLFLNAQSQYKSPKTKQRHFAPLDMFPTIISSMGVKIPGNRLGLGTDLFSNDQTLIERDGLDHFNKELSKRSNYYDSQFISERKNERK